ncbi:MAG: PAS domain S-box protein, partial [Rhodospirillales bacterium]|nr:PAS domain S-box protein [Rhodospirillales bacterium]
VGLDGSWLLVNNRLCEIVGYSRDELMRRTFQDITHPDDLEEDVALFGRLMRGELATYTAEKRYVRGDAKMVWVSLTTAVQTDEHGRALYCISVVQDISRRKQAERTLQENENRMRAILDASGDEILLVSTQGRVLAINKAAERRLARRLASMTPVGADLAQLLPPDLAEKRSAVVRDVARLGNPIHMDLPIRAGWFEFWFYPVRHADQPISEVAIFARDISERKRAESELRRLYQAIQQSPTSVVITDPNGCIVYVNPKFCELTGYGCDEVIGQNPRVLKSGYTSADEYKTLWETITSGRVWQGEFRNRKKNGELYWEIASIAPVKNDEGKIINFVAVKEDVTERRAIEEQFRQSQKMQAIGQLTGGIAHDFNNLLTIITGNLQLLQRTAGEQAPRLLADALWAAQRGGELTHRLLAFARMQPLRPSLINLNDVVRGLTGLLARTLGPKVEVVEALDPAVPGVFADAGELERAIVNLAINARDAMPEGGRLLLQTARAVLDDDYVEHHADVVPGDYVMLAVSDSGTGISPNMLSRIFEPFFTTKPVGRGSGLGLSMVYGFLKQSGGHASVYSEVGKGTTFKLFFPQAGQSNDAPGTPTATAERDVEFEAAGRTALVVEDEERLRLVAASLLQELGFAVLEAGDGAGALRQAEAAAGLDLLFTDVELPCGMNGIAVAHGIRRLHPGARVLYTTGYSAALTPGNGHVPSDAAVLVKPYARQQLIRHLRTLFPAEGGGSR